MKERRESELSMKSHYTLEELSEITSLTVRTLRNHIQRGLLTGQKENGKWYFSEEDLASFFSSKFVRQSMKIKYQTVARDFLSGPVKTIPSGCFLYDLPGKQEDLMQVCKQITELLNTEAELCSERMHFSFYYDEKSGVGSFALTGNIKLIGQVIELLQGIERVRG